MAVITELIVYIINYLATIPARRMHFKISSKLSFNVTIPAFTAWYIIEYSPDTLKIKNIDSIHLQNQKFTKPDR